jgi:hypothetical protein
LRLYDPSIESAQKEVELRPEEEAKQLRERILEAQSLIDALTIRLVDLELQRAK